jgi:hypothetical protein
MNSYILWKLDPSLRPDRPAPRAARHAREVEARIRRSDSQPCGAADRSRREAT